MGLDMYLEKHTYIGAKWFGKFEDNKDTVLNLDWPGIKPERVSYINEEIGYWRKANAIHQWFVDNTQNGVDDCQTSYVTEDHLNTLLSLVKQVQNNHELAHDLLPVQGGFFFGSLEYDEWYFEDLKITRKILEDALLEENGRDFYYRASW